MKLNITDKEIAVLRTTSRIAAGFTLIVAFTMIFSIVQLKIINPLDNPVLLSLKEQYDRDPSNATIAEQVRVMDLMARKAYFSSRWQVEAGSYLLLAGAVVFILCQRLISGKEKPAPVLPGIKQDQETAGMKNRKYLTIAASSIFVLAVGASFMLRSNLPDTREKKESKTEVGTVAQGNSGSEPDKTNFPFFRGQDGHGIAGGTGYPVEWNGAEGKNIAWKTEIPKPGQNSPVIWGDKIFLSGAQDKTCEVYCIDKASGSILWTGSASGIQGEPTDLPKMDADNGLATSTVAVDNKNVCAVFANGNLVCFDHDGKMKWSKNIGLPSNAYGYASSLLLYNGNLVVQFDSDAKVSIMAINAETGETKWETVRNGRPVWSSPVIAYFSGTPQVVINGNPYVSAYELESGKELWSVECMSGDVAPSVAVNSTLAYAVTDYVKLAAIKPGSGASIVWEDNMFTPDVSSPVATDEYLFLSTGVGDIACYNAQKGDTLWTHYFTEQFYASPTVADGKVYFLDRSGVMHIVNAGPKLEIIAESSLGERADCTPAFSDGKIFIRGKKNLYCISKN
ncbi:MAG TPA: PQQ-binding-like beta-propeller repeat protein [Bacteroidales bacterium]|nr:PQQ-binding-like beta-propeller repeat protein [Bacteroidales bacterium]